MNNFITQVRALVVTVITVGVLVVSPSVAQAGTANACGITTNAGDIKVNITSDTWLFSTGPTTSLHRPSITKSASIPKGTYRVVLEAQDFSDGRDKQTQPKEYYHVELKNGSTVVAKTGRTQDLQDYVKHATWRGAVNNKLVVNSPVTSVKAIQSAYIDNTNPNSVLPRCMVLRPVVDGQCNSELNGKQLSQKPTEDLCTKGNASTVSGTGTSSNPWKWSCDGKNGGQTAQCSATKVPAATCGIGTQAGDIKINISDDKWIFSTGKDSGLYRPAIAVGASVPKGAYKVILEAQDYSDGRDKQTQPKEYYHVELKNGSTVVAKTGRTPDLKDYVKHATWRGTVNDKLIISSNVDKVNAVHSAYLDNASPNSLLPVCMVLRPIDISPSINIIKRDATDKDDTQSVPYNGTAKFEIIVKNTGKVDLKTVKVTDPLAAACVKDLGGLKINESKTYTCESKNVTKDFTNIAYVVGNSVINNKEVKDNDPSKVTVVLPDPSIKIIKRDAADKDDTQEVKQGEAANFEIVVTNNGKVDLNTVKVTDPKETACVKDLGNLAVGQTKKYTCESKNVQEDFTNIAFVTGKSVINGQEVKDNDPTDVTVVIPGKPNIKIIKRDAADKDDTQEVKQGEAANFEIVVRNNGEVNLKNVVVTDPITPSCKKDVGDLAKGKSTSFTCESKDVQKDFTNIAFVTGESVETDEEVKDDDPTDVTVVIPGKPSIKIIKRDAADKDDTQEVKQGEAANFEIVVKNNGDVDLKNVTVTDPITPSCKKDVGDLAKGKSTSFTCESKDVQKDFTNIAFVTGESVETDEEVKDDDPTDVTVVVPGKPSIDIVKRDAKDGDDTQSVDKGGAATFEIIVTNNGSVDLKEVFVTDPLVEACERALDTLKVKESKKFTCRDENVQEAYTNTAHTVGESVETGEKVTDSDPSKVLVDVPEEPEEPEEPKKGKCGGSIGNTIWYDNNGNGVQDDGEAGIEDVKVKLIDGNDVEKDYTNTRGRYKHKELCAGDYTIVVHADDIPDGCYQTADPDSKLDHKTKVVLDGDDDHHTKADFGYRCPAGNVAPSTGPGAVVASVSAGLAGSLLAAYKLFVHGRVTRRPEEDGIMGTIIE